MESCYLVFVELFVMLRLSSTKEFCKKMDESASCRFPCNCQLGECTLSGHCAKERTCSPPFFGELCQYIDRAYEATAPKFAIDFNKDTCNRDRSSRAIVFLFNTEIRFFFMEIDFAHFSSVPMSLLKFSVRINFNDNAEDTRESMKILEKTPHKVQYYCDSKISFTKLTLHGRGISHICSVYVSGGRNFAAFNRNISINQTNALAEVSQTRINGDILHSVDNDISTCFHADNQNSWEINFHIHFLLSRIIIHNYKGRELVDARLDNFTLSLLYERNNERKDLVVTEGNKDRYDLLFDAASVLQVTLRTPNDAIAFCEIEVLGDCPKDLSGPTCSHRCASDTCDTEGNRYLLSAEMPFVYRKMCANCLDCDDTTGLCGGDCNPGYKGSHCLEVCGYCSGDGICNKESGVCPNLCQIGYYGKNCNQNCSQCKDGYCNRETGDCQSGCEVKYTGLKCEEECPRCGGDGSCNQQDEKCLYGCPAGFRGDKCLFECGKCAGNGNCDQRTGICHDFCKPGYWTPDCTKTCGQCNKQKCNISDGRCLHGCLKGFKGDTCKINCKNCLQSLCDDSGHCIMGCFMGFAGEDCETACQNCNKTNFSCNRTNFLCLYGCDTGFFGNDCHSPCGKCAGDGTCHRLTGTCYDGCIAGYKGFNCKVIDEIDPIDTTTVYYGMFVAFICLFVWYTLCCDGCLKNCQEANEVKDRSAAQQNREARKKQNISQDSKISDTSATSRSSSSD
ncbi:uncharacterized protein LOC106074796 isoform X2 [Biomphalaria glabrata]|uniref:Uncharacterized protein LOC106074796 isoform X2 n=1 Tax=Biomphalaria glabrata TaxID=6526 RepID=A0A9W3ACL1_BIOGL|nr:uncharacterized protein LOC106074796 isoform X2 [Biomphalaria glabrata]